MPIGDPAPMRAWEDGVDLPAVAAACHGMAVLAYARDVDRVRADLDAYARLLPRGVHLTVGVRPMPPDCYNAVEMTLKTALLRECGVVSMDVYHYGLMRLQHLDWVGEAVRSAAG